MSRTISTAARLAAILGLGLGVGIFAPVRCQGSVVSKQSTTQAQKKLPAGPAA